LSSKVNNPNNSLPYHVRGAFRGFETALSRYLATKDIPLSHFYILRLQWDSEGSSQKHIAEKAFMTESVASQVIKSMEKDGLLRRKADLEDSRRRRVFLTSKGQKAREDLVIEGMTISKRHAPDISPEDIRTTIKVLMKIREGFDLYNADYLKENS